MQTIPYDNVLCFNSVDREMLCSAYFPCGLRVDATLFKFIYVHLAEYLHPILIIQQISNNDKIQCGR